jgi:dUTP pyrophosphatase
MTPDHPSPTNDPTRELIVEFKKLHPNRDKDIPLPRYMTPHAAGMDICAAVADTQVIEPERIALIATGFAMALPYGFEAQIRPRSGLAVKHGVTIINAPGTIDSDYRGEVKIGLINLGRAPYTIKRGERIAQMVIQQVFQPRIRQVKALDATARDSGGFGSTGL